MRRVLQTLPVMRTTMSPEPRRDAQLRFAVVIVAMRRPADLQSADLLWRVVSKRISNRIANGQEGAI